MGMWTVVKAYISVVAVCATMNGVMSDIQQQVDEMQQQLDQLLVDTYPVNPVTVGVDCNSVNISGVYTIQPSDNGEEFRVFCDAETDGGGWLVFQRRQDGSTDFYRSFVDYGAGFGWLYAEFWLGNDKLHRLTTQGDYELRIDLTDFDGSSAYAVYDSFSISDASDKYTLALGEYSGTAGDSLKAEHNGAPFSTYDADNDFYTTINCASYYRGAWWFVNCHWSHLNGYYYAEGSAKGLIWKTWKTYDKSIKGSEMKIRRNN